MPARFHDSQIILSWNSGSRDFTDRQVQLLHLLGMLVGVLARRIEQRRHLQRLSDALSRGLRSIPGQSLMNAPFAPVLRSTDERILTGLIQGESRADIAASLQWRRDTLDRHLAMLRERLGYENTAQLMQALASLRPAQAASTSATPAPDA